jgi:hypothetical protein
MGVYIDTVRAESIPVLLHGNRIEVHALKFLCKPLYAGMGDELVRSQKMALARAEWYWNRRALPKYIAYVYRGFETGAEVIEWTGSFMHYDCEKTPGRVIGKLIVVPDNSRKGFHWEVESNMLELNPT